MSNLLLGFLVIWIAEIFYIKNFFQPNLYFTFLKNFVGTLLTISMINKLIRGEKKRITQNPKFVVCIAFMIYCFGEIIPLIFRFRFLKVSNAFQKQMVYLENVDVTIMYFLFTYALIIMARENISVIRQVAILDENKV